MYNTLNLPIGYFFCKTKEEKINLLYSVADDKKTSQERARALLNVIKILMEKS